MFPITTNFVTNTVHSTLTYTLIPNNSQYEKESSPTQPNSVFPSHDVTTAMHPPSNFENSNFTNGNISNHDSYAEYAEIPYYIKATSMTFCIVIMCLGVIGNVMVPIVILKTKDMRNSTNIFLVNLSIADLMVLLVCTPTVLVEVNSKPETWVLGKELCLAVPFVELTVAHASVLTILAISFERYYAICEPLRAGYVCTKTRAALICGLAWFFAALFTSPILVIAEHRTIEKQDGRSYAQCVTQAITHWQITFFVLVITVLYIIPLIILIILYSIIAKNLLSAASKVVMNKTLDPSNTRARKQVIMMLGTVVLSFFLCLMPYRILALWIIITPIEVIQDVSPEKWYNFLYFSRIMLYINSAVNPILYNLMSSKFRIGFCKICVCNRREEETNENISVFRKRTGTLTTGSTTSSSLSRTTNSLKKLFHKNSLERNNLKSETDIEARENCLQNNEITSSSLYDRYVKIRYLRQQSAPVCATGNSKSNKINRMRSEGNMYQIHKDGDRSDIYPVDCDQAFIAHNDSKDVEDKSKGSLRRNVLVNSVKTKCEDDDVYQKVDVDFVFACKKSLDVCDFPESYV